MAEMAEIQGPSIQPWHTFTAMFVTFWAVSAYFDHFLMTIVFCVAFGVLAEIYSKIIMEGDGANRAVKIDDDAEEERKMLKKLEEERIKQELEILEIMKAEEELERQKKLLIEKSQRAEGNDQEENGSHNQVFEIEEAPVAHTADADSVVMAVHETEEDIPPALPSKDFVNTAVCESGNLLSDSDAKIEDLVIENEDEEEFEDEAPPPVPCRDFFDVTVNEEEDSFETENFNTRESYHGLPLQDEEETQNDLVDKDFETTTSGEINENGEPESPDQTEVIGQIEEQNTINNLIFTREEESQIEPKHCVLDENEVNNKIVSMLETTMDMMDKRHFQDSEDLISSPENVSENEEKLIDFENDVSIDEGINFEIQHNDDKSENIFDNDKTSESLLDSPDSQNFSEEMNLVAEDAGRKELDSSITETKLDDGETLCDNLGLSDGILDTDKKIVDCKEAGVTKTEEVTEIIDIDLTDPAVEAAATKIQSAFKGFKTRKKISQT